MPKKYRQGCIDVIALDERLLSDDVDAARSLCVGVLERGVPQMVVDLARVRVVDSVGLEWLCDIGDACRQRGGELKLAAPGAVVQDALRVTGVDERIGVCPDVIAAAGEFAR